MDAREVEGEDARPDLRIAGAVDLEVLDLAEAGERLPDELRVVPADRLAAQALHVVDGRAQADAPAMGGVPGSNRHGRSFQVARSSQTSRMISLPPKNGSSGSSTSRRP